MPFSAEGTPAWNDAEADPETPAFGTMQKQRPMYSSLVESQHQESIIKFSLTEERQMEHQSSWDADKVVGTVLGHLEAIKESSAFGASTLGEDSSPGQIGSRANKANASTLLDSSELEQMQQIVHRFDNLLRAKQSILGHHGGDEPDTEICLGSLMESPASKDYNYRGERNIEDEKRDGFGISECLLTGKSFVGLHKDDKYEFGIMVYPNGSSYIGSFENGHHQGNGFSLSQDGTFFLGEWLAGKMQGQGITVWESASSFYRGTWKAGVKHGQGQYLQKDGTRYTGSWHRGKMHGQGVLEYPTGNRYEGRFQDSLKHGSGILTFANGGFYKGLFYRNEYNGKGTYEWADGSVYEGEYQEGRRSGVGILRKTDGRTYDGEWLENKRHGRVVFTDTTGTEFEEHWQHGKRVSRTSPRASVSE